MDHLGISYGYLYGHVALLWYMMAQGTCGSTLVDRTRAYVICVLSESMTASTLTKTCDPHRSENQMLIDAHATCTCACTCTLMRIRTCTCTHTCACMRARDNHNMFPWDEPRQDSLVSGVDARVVASAHAQGTTMLIACMSHVTPSCLFSQL
mmetsp:Transcript_50147/g.99886  ORF Transcript_50147/g.99886 Transcript_50147/m.99886 type:complete len:152 (+) Transcript_50147:609-1064(+)